MCQEKKCNYGKKNLRNIDFQRSKARFKPDNTDKKYDNFAIIKKIFILFLIQIQNYF